MRHAHRHLSVCMLLKSANGHGATDLVQLLLPPQTWFSSCCRTSHCLFLPSIVSLEATRCPGLTPVGQVDELPGSAAWMRLVFLSAFFYALPQISMGLVAPGSQATAFISYMHKGIAQYPGPQRVDQLLQVPWAWNTHRVLPPALCLRRVCRQ